jgi:hypothetical protein
MRRARLTRWGRRAGRPCRQQGPAPRTGGARQGFWRGPCGGQPSPASSATRDADASDAGEWTMTQLDRRPGFAGAGASSWPRRALAAQAADPETPYDYIFLDLTTRKSTPPRAYAEAVPGARLDITAGGGDILACSRPRSAGSRAAPRCWCAGALRQGPRGPGRRPDARQDREARPARPYRPHQPSGRRQAATRRRLRPPLVHRRTTTSRSS